MAIVAFIVSGGTAFYTHRAEHGRTPEERQAYWIDEKAGEQASTRRKIADAGGIEHDGPEVFRAAGIGKPIRIGIWHSNTVTRTDSTRRIRAGKWKPEHRTSKSNLEHRGPYPITEDTENME